MRTQAIILKKIPLKEHDELIVCYTEHAGKQTYRAKSILRSTSKQGRHADVLNHIDFSVIEGFSHPIMASATCLNAYRNLKSNLPALATAFFVVECFDKVVYDGEADNRLWRYLKDTLDACDQHSNIVDWSAFANRKFRELLAVMGYSTATSAGEFAGAPLSSLQFLQSVVESQ
mgnify:CR=1 FL=1